MVLLVGILLSVSAAAESGTLTLSVDSSIYAQNAISVKGETESNKQESDDPSKVKTTIVSPALQILAQQYEMAMASIVGNDICFSQDSFGRALNMSSVGYITVESLPSESAGRLVIGSTTVVKGQKISAVDINKLSFVPRGDEKCSATFDFSHDGNGYAIKCNLFMLDRLNYCPTVSVATAVSLNVSTHKNVTAYGSVSAYDPDGDQLKFDIVKYPEHGYITMTGTCGEYTYTPINGYVGQDSFTYVARDKYGNYSASAKVSLTVNAPLTSVTYFDLDGKEEHNAALTLTEKGIMGGTQIGDKYYFYPDMAVSRVEFLVMTMKAVGITEVPEVDDTGFYDDANIPTSVKGYVSSAYALGYISGKSVGGKLCFNPDESITRAEAAVIISNIIGISTPTITPVFADASAVPSWASSAIYSLNYLGILDTSNGYVSPSATVTRGQCASMLAGVIENESMNKGN